MDAVPVLYIEALTKLLSGKCQRFLKEIDVFGPILESLQAKALIVCLGVTYVRSTDTFRYSLQCARPALSNNCLAYNPADHRNIFALLIVNFDDEEIDKDDGDAVWTTATRTDPTFLKWLQTPFPVYGLCLETHCPEFLELLPDYCTFNMIKADESYNERVDAIIRRSQESGRLVRVDCVEFFTRLGEDAFADWIATNPRMRNFSNVEICTVDCSDLFGFESDEA